MYCISQYKDGSIQILLVSQIMQSQDTIPFLQCHVMEVEDLFHGLNGGRW